MGPAQGLTPPKSQIPTAGLYGPNLVVSTPNRLQAPGLFEGKARMGEKCPQLQKEGLRLDQSSDKYVNITGFNLIKRFALLKTSAVKKIRNPKGPMILRLGGTPLVQPTKQLFPRGLPDEFTLVITLLLKKQTSRENWYLFQVTDRQGYPQLSLGINSKERSMELRAKGQDTEFVGAVFAGHSIASLFDLKWHKVTLSVQSQVVSVHIDCSYISSKPLLPRQQLAVEGNAFVGLDAVRGSPVSFDIQQLHIYCDPAMAMHEGCCELSRNGCFPEASKTRRDVEVMQSNDLIEINPQTEGKVYTRCFCLEETQGKQEELRASGKTGTDGNQGEKGEKGARGEKGDPGECTCQPGSRVDPNYVGLPGPQALQSIEVHKNICGDCSQMQPTPVPGGIKGEKGDQGMPGAPGIVNCARCFAQFPIAEEARLDLGTLALHSQVTATMTGIVLELLAILACPAYLETEESRDHQAYEAPQALPDRPASRVSGDRPDSLEPKGNWVPLASLAIPAQWAPQGSLVLQAWMVRWVPVGQRVREENEDCRVVREKRVNRDFKASLDSRGHPDLQAFQEKQDHQGLRDLKQKRDSRGKLATQASQDKRGTVASRDQPGILAGVEPRESRVLWGLKADRGLLAMWVSQAQMDQQEKRAPLESQALQDHLDRRASLEP
ncbi:hypothetical protein lerEdw1_007234 [Lerista edwardsae]|nr:hypothetical protein lerEdw1_007234 [Lerista edwardsae]